MSPSPSIPSCVQTCIKNVNQHPGLAIPKRTRRSREEVDAEKAMKKEKAEAAAKARQAHILAAATLKSAIQEKDKQAAIGIADKKQAPAVTTSKDKTKGTAKAKSDGLQVKIISITT